MGKNNNVIINYLSDRVRFADMINAELYGGRQVIKPEGLTQISADTYMALGKARGDVSPKRRERRGDLAMKYEDGSIFRVFLAEAQNKVLYLLPVRSLEYLASSYKKQCEEFKNAHERNDDYGSVAERFSGLNKTDRLKPTHLLWLYHGEETWDGPRTLKDMMDFGNDADGFSKVFQDFVPHLLCINEMKDTANYKTELKMLLDLLIKRSDKGGLKELVDSDERYHKLDPETYETAAVLMNAPSLWKKRKAYSDQEGGTYDMCKALRDWEAEIIEEKDKEMCKALRDMKAEIIEQKEKEFQDMKAEIIEEKDKEMRKALRDRDAKIEEKDAQIDKLEKEVANLRKQLAEASAD